MPKKTLERQKPFVLYPFLGLLCVASVLPYKVVVAQEQGGGTVSSLSKKDSIASAIKSLLAVERNTRTNPLVSDVNQGESLRFLNDQENAEPEDLVLAVFVDRQNLSPGIFAVQDNGRFYLPFSTMSEILGFEYETNLSEGFVSGWAVEERNDYSIDTQRGQLRYKGERFPLPEDAVLDENITDDDFYVLVDVLEQIWPLRLNITLNNLVLRVVPDGKLPFQVALERELKRERARETKARFDGSEQVLPFVALPYQRFTKPTVDVSANFGYDENRDRLTGRLNVNGVNDLAYASADYSATTSFFGGEVREPENIRFRLTRDNIHEGALPFGLERVQAGDVRLPNRELISSDVIGRGVVLTNESQNRVGSFDRVTIEGTGAVGWEVELYRNDQLLEFGDIDERGEYRFEDVPVGFGNNRFRIVLYGPQGQIRERVENYTYQSNMVQKGKTTFSAGLIDANRDLIPIDPRDDFRGRGLSGNVYGAYGVGSRLTAFATANAIRDREGENTSSREYLSTGLIGSLGTTLLQLEGYKELSGGNAVDVRGLSTFKGFNLNAQVSVFDDFQSPAAQNGLNALTLETDVRLRRNFRTSLGSLGLEVNHNYREREDDQTDQRWLTRQSLGVSGARFTNTTTTNITDNSHSTSTGRFSASKRKKGWNYRGSAIYNLFPDVDLTAIEGDLRYGRNRSYRTGFFGSYNFSNDEIRLGSQVSRDFKKFLGSAEADWSSRGGFGFLLRASAAAGPFGEDGSYRYRSLPLTNVGPVTSFVYNDKNYNDVFDANDEPVPDVKIALDRRITKKGTSKNGRIIEVVSDRAGLTNIKVADDSIEDPYFVSGVQGFGIYPRPGVLHTLDFPLVETGAIDGTLRWSPKGKSIPGVILQLLDDEANVVQTTKTASDGYYTFERVPPGNYNIRSAPESGLDIPFKRVTLTPDNLFQFGTDFDGSGEPLFDVNGQEIENITVDQSPINFAEETRVEKDGTLSVKNILSVAKGVKNKQRSGFQNASVSTVQNNKAEIIKASGGKPVVTDLRIGKHPNKVRLVMDLTKPVEYSIDYDRAASTLYVDMPYAAWAADKNTDVINSYIANRYDIEKTQQGVRVMIDVENGIEIGATGLLKANGIQNDRLFIDIEKR